MKVLLIGPAHPLRGGIAQFLALLYNALGKAGHDVVFHRFIRQYPKFLFPGKTQDDESKSPVEVNSTASLDPLNPFNWPFAAYRIAKEKPDLVIAKWWMPFFGPSYIFTLWLAKLICGTKVMFIVDNAIPHEKRPGDMLITKIGFAVSDYFVVMSDAVKKDLLSIKPDAKYVYSPHPLYDIFGTAADPDEAKKALGISGPAILFFGFVRHYKGLDILLGAMPRILEKLKLTLVVAGEFYEERAAYDEQIKSLGIAEHVRMMDRFIANEEVAGIFSAADALVLPYRSATQSGITQIAYVFGTPVIATTVGGLPEVVTDGETGILVPPEDPGAVADAVVRFFAEGGAARYKAAIDREKRRFSWEAMVEAIEGLAGK
jgi:D-inositol-3-phosphate glycosyltransferase